MVRDAARQSPDESPDESPRNAINAERRPEVGRLRRGHDQKARQLWEVTHEPDKGRRDEEREQLRLAAGAGQIVPFA